ncbi:MAG: rhodanese-like domain-containing protein [Deltaproteobacteria bacterium]
MKRITREELKDQLDNGRSMTLVEALPEKYWRKAHLPGALQIDYTEIEEKADRFLPDKESKIVVYCANTECQNSTKAAQILESLGYNEVYEYVEGKQDWADAGFPLVSRNGN